MLQSTILCPNVTSPKALTPSTWINYGHPDERSKALNKSKVAAHIGKYYRNRSKPTQRAGVLKPDVESSVTREKAIDRNFQVYQRDWQTGAPNKPYQQHEAIRDSEGHDSQRNRFTNVTKFQAGIPHISTGSVRLTSTQQIVLKYFEQHALQAIFRDELIVAFGQEVTMHRFYPAVQQVLQHALNDELQLHALIASAASRMVLVLPDNATYRIEAAKSTNQAISRLRIAASCDSNPLYSSPKLAHAILELAIAAFYHDDLYAAKTHLKAVKAMSGFKPSHDRLSVFITEVARLVDVFIAVETGEPPIFGLDWEPRDVESPLRVNVMLEGQVSVEMLDDHLSGDPKAYHTTEELLYGGIQSLPTWNSTRLYPMPFHSTGNLTSDAFFISQDGLLEAVSQGILSWEVSQVIAKNRLLWEQIAELIVLGASLTPKLEWINIRGMANLYQMCTLTTSLTLQPSSSTYILNIPVLIALQIQNCACHLPLLTRTMQKLAVRLRNALSSLAVSEQLQLINNGHGVKLAQVVTESAKVSFCQTLFWVVFTGLFASYSSIQHRKWFRRHAIGLLESIGVRSATAIATLLARFTTQSQPVLVRDLVQALRSRHDLAEY